MAQLVKNPPAMRETWVRSLGWEDPPVPFLCLWRRKASNQVSSGGQVGTQSLYLYLQEMEDLRKEKGMHGGWGGEVVTQDMQICGYLILASF